MALAKRRDAAYTVCSYSISTEVGAEMDRQEWITRCSARLHAQWPRLRREQRDEVASELHGDDRWQSLEPECAVVEWLRQGIPTPEARRDVG